MRAPPRSSEKDVRWRPPSIVVQKLSVYCVMMEMSRFRCTSISSDGASPRVWSSLRDCEMRWLTRARSAGSLDLMCLSRTQFRRFPRYSVPILPAAASCAYEGCSMKNFFSSRLAADTSFLSLMSFWLRLTTPMKPSLSGTTLLYSISRAFVPLSMRSILVMTPMVRSPSGSTALLIWIASEVAMSELAGVTDRMIELGFAVYLRTRSRICISMSLG
mmetsp:Transcript_37070/g.75051  ORF Transcript_37070/g.75051 Transcript_37070/m.75051 type:complete len:217 (+) Transcript_37070:629-1279(+)